MKILITGGTGMVAGPVIDALAAENEVWCLARFSEPRARAAREGWRAHVCLEPRRRPLAPLVTKERRFIYAGIGDRVTKPEEAYRHWWHWGRPEVLWFSGPHIGAVFDQDVRSFVDGALKGSDAAA